MEVPSWLDSIENEKQAAVILAQRAIRGRYLRMQKIAAWWSPAAQFGGNMGELLKNSPPAVRWALVGMLLGGEAGGLLSLAREKKKRDIPGNILTGALAGAGVGGGMGLIGHNPLR